MQHVRAIRSIRTIPSSFLSPFPPPLLSPPSPPAPSADSALARPARARPLLRTALVGLVATALVACGGGGDPSATGVDAEATAALGTPGDTTDAMPGTLIDSAVARAPDRPNGNGTNRQNTTTDGGTNVTPVIVNSLDTIAADMRLMNDLTLRGYETRTVGWYVGPGYNQMGNDPRTTNTAEWFKKAYPWFINDTYMRAVLPWMVIFDGVGHAATNTRVHLRNVRAFYKSRATGQWISYGWSPGASGYGTPKSSLYGGSMPENKRTNADGSVEIKPPADSNYAWHGWWSLGRVAIDPTDIAAVFVTLQARLVVDDTSRPDDRASARLLVQVGADYYPDKSTGWPGPNPAVATSRVKLVKNTWQSFNMTTFSDVGIQDPGGGISEAAFRAAPPPME